MGGSNGATSSNTYYLENKYDWDGICIEVNQSFYKELIKNRSCKTYFACVAGESRDVFFNNDGATGSIDENGVAMKSVPLSQILDENDMLSVIDYLSLDVEGFEEEILINFPFDRYQFNVMTIERPSTLFHDKILQQGYKLFKRIEVENSWIDNVYVHESLQFGL